MGVLEALHIAESGNKPIVHVGPSQRRLDCLQCEDEISCSRFALTSQTFGVMSKTHLAILWIVCRLRNCSYIRLNVGKRSKQPEFRGTAFLTNLDAESAVQCPVE